MESGGRYIGASWQSYVPVIVVLGEVYLGDSDTMFVMEPGEASGDSDKVM